MLQLSESRFIVTDIETTGLSPDRDRITEVACVVVQGGEVVGEHRTLVNPEKFIPSAIQSMTGITNAMVLAAPKGGEIFPEIRSWLESGSVFVAHNVSFDFNFLQASFRRHGIDPLALPTLCTARLARRILPARKSWALGALTGYLGIRVRGRHTALGDARATAQALIHFLETLQEDHDFATLRELLSFQHRTFAAGKEVPANIRALEPTLAGLPSRPGVYRMLDRRGYVLYVGKAKNLRERVGSYFRPGADHPTKIRELLRRVRSIETDETGSELGALLLESRQIKEYQPKYNTLQKRLRRYHFVRLDLGDDFPTVTIAPEIGPDGAEYFGPFRGRFAAQLIIDTIQQLFGLRECEGKLTPSPLIIPCIYHQIERCGAPCAKLQTVEQYRSEVERVRDFLSGSQEGILTALEEQMRAHASALRFEDAALLRDKVNELRKIFTGRRNVADSINLNNVIIVLPAVEPGKREIFLVRFGRLARQVIVGRRVPHVKLRALIARVYADGSSAPPRFKREEVEEIRILASYIHIHRDTGRFVYVRPEASLDDVAERIAAALAPVRREGESSESNGSERSAESVTERHGEKGTVREREAERTGEATKTTASAEEFVERERAKGLTNGGVIEERRVGRLKLIRVAKSGEDASSAKS